MKMCSTMLYCVVLCSALLCSVAGALAARDCGAKLDPFELHLLIVLRNMTIVCQDRLGTNVTKAHQRKAFVPFVRAGFTSAGLLDPLLLPLLCHGSGDPKPPSKPLDF